MWKEEGGKLPSSTVKTEWKYEARASALAWSEISGEPSLSESAVKVEVDLSLELIAR